MSTASGAMTVDLIPCVKPAKLKEPFWGGKNEIMFVGIQFGGTLVGGQAVG